MMDAFIHAKRVFHFICFDPSESMPYGKLTIHGDIND